MRYMKDSMVGAIKMKVAILSGKGGTGKTLLSVNLAALEDSLYIDCDVEEPNGHLFLKARELEEEEIKVKVPVVDNNLCNGCRKCTEFCRYNALTYMKDKLVIFEDICHSCGGCILVCPEKALSEKDMPIGKIQTGLFDNVKIHTGILNIGEPSGIPIIDRLLEKIKEHKEGLAIIDCPPGSACSVMESIKDADYCVLVAEPTIFGAHNLNMVYELVKLFNKPHGVVLNKSLNLETDNPSKVFCIDNKISILGEIPFDNELGNLNSNGKIAVKESKKYKELFLDLLDKIKGEVRHHETTTNT